MEPFDLISEIHPPGGWVSLCGIRPGKGIQTKWFQDTNELYAQVTAWKDTHDIYFGVSSFEASGDRTKGNVASVKAFWLDLDCGPNKAPPKGYLTKREAAEALVAFCAKLKLPQPTLVDSGGGIHAYWILEEAITREEWEDTAAALKSQCVKHKLHADPAVFEVSRILRVPDTLNYKTGTPRPTLLKVVGETTTHEEFRARLGLASAVITPAKKRESLLGKEFAAAAEEAAKDFPASNFAKIATQCRQIQKCIMEAATLEEPRWRAALSVATVCVDREDGITAVSDGHPDYDPDAAEAKALGTKGPYSCAQFELLAPGGCKGCPHQKKISCPISLGIVGEEPDEDAEDEFGGATAHALPQRYYRDKHGNIWRRNGDESKDTLVCEMPLYVVKRMRDPEKGDVIVLRLYTLRDGVREFVITNRCLVDKAELRKELASEGVLAGDKQYADIGLYINDCVKGMQRAKALENMRTQFGWADDDTKFILGERELTATDDRYTPPAAIMKEDATRIGTKGTMEKWQEVFNLYATPGLEPHAFGALTGFGAPLFKLCGHSGLIINLIHPKSGGGKTTILHMCNSIYGNPKTMCGKEDDTANARIGRLGVYKNLPFCVDEMTNMKPDEFSRLAYAMTQGRGKDRMRQHSNALRHNSTSWQTISLCSSNASFQDKLLTLKASPDGELMRLFEYRIEYSDALDITHARELFDHQLLANYGHAGPIFLQYVLGHWAEVEELWRKVEKRLMDAAGIVQKERFRTGGIVSNLTGGIIAKRLGLIDYDLGAIFKWVVAELLAMRNDAHVPETTFATAVGEFLLANVQNTLVVNVGLDKQTGMQPMPKQEPKGELRVRFEQDTKRVSITSKAFLDYCALKQMPYKQYVTEMSACGALLSIGQKRLSAGMKLAGPAVNALELDFNHPMFADVVPVVEAQEAEDPDAEH